MTSNTTNAEQECAVERVGKPMHPGGHTPTLEIRVFGGFDAQLDGVPVDSAYTRQRRIQALLGILALYHGQELYSDYLAESIWPLSVPSKQRHCFYNLWYLATRSIYDGPREANPYFRRRQGTCCLLDEFVRTDVEEVARACDDLMARDLDATGAVDAYRRLQASYRGDLLPGEAENSIILRERNDWRERVSSALSAAAQTMVDRGEDRTALWLATVACRLSGLREDVARLRMELFAKMGMQAYAVRAYNELESALRDEAGLAPSPQSVQLIQQVVDANDFERAMSAATPSPRRRGMQRRPPARQKKPGFVMGDVLSVSRSRMS